LIPTAIVDAVPTEWAPGKPCAICQQWNGEVLSCKDGVAVVRCRDCSLHYVDATPLDGSGEAEQSRLETDRGPVYLREVYEKNHHRWTQYYSQHLTHLATFTRGRRLLDVGCATGHFVRVACDKGWDAYGADTSIGSVEYGQTKLGLQDRLYGGWLADANFPKNSFDVLSLYSVIEHVPDPARFLMEMGEYLRPGGILVLKTPSQDSLLTMLHWTVYRLTGNTVSLDLYNREHIYRFSPRTLSALLRRTGFEVQYSGFDDQLWITATRYLLFKRLPWLQYLGLAAINRGGRLLGMQNQIFMIARKKERA
jgi:2-polyprenyl-3-methyl-5-hydroxy-6-metoxy-1,4-benzoquinol methylase